MGLTYDELYITPENSTINILVKTGIIHELAELLKKKDELSHYCSGRDCTGCMLNGSNWSSGIKMYGDSCSNIRNTVMQISGIVKVLESDSKKQDSEACAYCKYITEVGEFTYCTAWKNFTTHEMYCGYFEKMLDK